MHGAKNLTQGPINRQLFGLAMPIMATSFIQMAYSLTDMAWVGRLGSEAVAAVGAVGILTWMSGSIALLNKVGSEVSVGQSIGAQNREDARAFASHNISIALLIAVCWGGLLFVFARPVMRLFELEPHITENAVTYLRIISTALPFVFLSAAFTGIYNASGRSKTPFYISGTGLVMNILLDPLFIFGFGWGTVGAALATWLAEASVCFIFVYKLRRKDDLLGGFPFFVRLKKKYSRRIFKLGLPVATLNTLYAFVNMFLSRTAAEQGGHIGLMAFTTGGQIEAITWNTSQGFSTGLSTFIAQNYAAGQKARVWQAWKTTLRDDGRVRHALLAAVHLLRQRAVLRLRARGSGLSRGRQLPAHRRLLATVHDAGNHHAGRILRHRAHRTAGYRQHRVQLHAHSGSLAAGANGYGRGCHLVGGKRHHHRQGNNPDGLVYLY